MSSNIETSHEPAAAQTQPSARKNSYSRKRWNAFDAWQEHVRTSAPAAGVSFGGRHDRDLRRSVVAG
jgi:hypothetical protein